LMPPGWLGVWLDGFEPDIRANFSLVGQQS